MVVVVTCVVIAAILAIAWSLVVLARRIWRATGQPMTVTRHRDEAPPYGGLPGLGPVGSLGGLSPDAEIDSTGSDPGELYGE